ncbi:hypothetical protein CEW91_09935 [Idiomarina piscisalsi]|uniref:Uncharacterized protein n=1 Tax=Idiomarina piscisalsi TaxID=1096243 RepID=A0ABN5ARV7_9GAMM|nr:hypothetical protein [Idiomarina piscisalsi]ASG66435.1 hypothetical protein CEW91_09935 [Idiomarina piscisalsi]
MSSNQVNTAQAVTCCTMKELYDVVRTRPFNQPFAVHYQDGRTDFGLNSEEDLRASLRSHGNPFLKDPVDISVA